MDRETVEEIKRHFGVVVEDLRSEFRMVAEGQVLLREDLTVKIDSLDRKVDKRMDDLTHIVQLTHSEVTNRLNDHETQLEAAQRRAP
jgi:hypothetical protein